MMIFKRDKLGREWERAARIDVARLQKRKLTTAPLDKAIAKFAKEKAKELGIAPGPLYRALVKALMAGESTDAVVETAEKLAKEKGRAAAEAWLESYAGEEA
ncbi:MAG: hypothetical protein QW680_10475 [Pyrobaculum sp.]|jgi:hypothetical protein|uniref:hypothetical protein n=1 Tax=Pyrobaculum sp. TaxID=2004705 RepID=UPI003169FA86